MCRASRGSYLSFAERLPEVYKINRNPEKLYGNYFLRLYTHFQVLQTYLNDLLRTLSIRSGLARISYLKKTNKACTAAHQVLLVLNGGQKINQGINWRPIELLCSNFIVQVVSPPYLVQIFRLVNMHQHFHFGLVIFLLSNNLIRPI